MRLFVALVCVVGASANSLVDYAADCGSAFLVAGSCSGNVTLEGESVSKCTATQPNGLAVGFGVDGCSCDDGCGAYGDCCANKVEECGGDGNTMDPSCAGSCYAPGVASSVWNKGVCRCGKGCEDWGDCCTDFLDECGSEGAVGTCSFSDCLLSKADGRQPEGCFCDVGCYLREDCCPNFFEACRFTSAPTTGSPTTASPTTLAPTVTMAPSAASSAPTASTLAPTAAPTGAIYTVFFEASLTFTQAQEKCIEKGGVLATPRTQEEMDEIADIANATTGSTKDIWIGGICSNNCSFAESWTMLDGPGSLAVDTFPWKNNRPMDSHGDACLYIGGIGGGANDVRDQSCDNTERQYACEGPVTEAPTSSTAPTTSAPTASAAPTSSSAPTASAAPTSTPAPTAANFVPGQCSDAGKCGSKDALIDSEFKECFCDARCIFWGDCCSLSASL